MVESSRETNIFKLECYSVETIIINKDILTLLIT